MLCRHLVDRDLRRAALRRRPAGEGDPGHAAGAPANPRLWLKAPVTTVIAAVDLAAGLLGGRHADLINFRGLSDERRILRGWRPAIPSTAPITTANTAFPRATTRVLFERLVLEINQAGLSWLTVLKKRAAFAAAFAGFDIDRVARVRRATTWRGCSPIPASSATGSRSRRRSRTPGALQAIARQPRLLRRLARRASSALQGRVGEAVPRDLPLHRRRDRRRVPDEPRLSAGRACAGLPGPSADPRSIRPGVGACHTTGSPSEKDKAGSGTEAETLKKCKKIRQDQI